MTNKPNKEDVERVALEFAKEFIDTSNGWKSAGINDELMERATRMAIDWLAGEELRSNIVEQCYPDWVDLSEKNESPRIERDKTYWFVAKQIDGKYLLPEIIKARVVDMHESFNVWTVEVEDINDAGKFEALYFIPENSSEIFKQDFQPLPPEGVKVKNTKFSPHFSYGFV